LILIVLILIIMKMKSTSIRFLSIIIWRVPVMSLRCCLLMICLSSEKIWLLHKTQMIHLRKETLSLELNNLSQFQTRKRRINLSLELCLNRKLDNSGVLMTFFVIKVYIMKLTSFKILTKPKKIWLKTIPENLLRSREISSIQKFWQDQLVP
jgi:hypothetical protein